MLNTIISLLQQLPDYALGLWASHKIPVIIALIIFVFVLFFSNKVAQILRLIFVVAVIAFGGYGYYKGNYVMIALAVCVLLILILVRIIIYAIRTIRQNQLDRRLEERALEKAAKRRGNWENRQGYSGEQKPIVQEFNTEKMDQQEIVEVITNEVRDDSIREETIGIIEEIHEAEQPAIEEAAAEQSVHQRLLSAEDYEETDDD